MRLSACDVTSTNFLGRFCVSRKDETGGDGWVHPKGANSMVVSGLSFRKALVGTGWTVFLFLFMIEHRKQSSHLTGPLFPALNSLDGRLLARSADCPYSGKFSGIAIFAHAGERGSKNFKNLNFWAWRLPSIVIQACGANLGGSLPSASSAARRTIKMHCISTKNKQRKSALWVCVVAMVKG